MILNIFCIPNKKEDAVFCNEATLIENRGMLGDYHADGGDKQLMIVSKVLFDSLKSENGLCFNRFKPNLVVEERLQEGFYKIGDCTIKVKQHSKKCFSECMKENKENCLMKEHIFEGMVVSGGTIHVGESLCFVKGL